MVTALIITRAVHIAASILVAGAFTFDLIALGLTDRSVSNDLDDVDQRLIHLALWSLITALLSALFWFWLEVASMSELSLKNALSATAWGTVLFETQFGRVWQFRLGLIAAAFVLVASALAQVKARRMLLGVLWLVSVVLLVSLARISHASAATERPFGVLGDVLHLCAAGLWIGGLVPLTIFLARVRGSFSLGEKVVRVVRRFSTLSLWCVTVLIVSGISNSWLLVGSVHALFTTPYGRLLLVKLTLFGMLLGFGARNRFLVKAKLPKLLADPDLLSQLRRNVVCEIYLGVAVVVIVACLGVTPPAISMMHAMR
jgi:putative copper resistance protein D